MPKPDYDATPALAVAVSGTCGEEFWMADELERLAKQRRWHEFRQALVAVLAMSINKTRKRRRTEPVAQEENR